MPWGAVDAASPMTQGAEVRVAAEVGPAPNLFGRWRRRRGLLLEALSETWLPWLTARVITLFALGLAKYEVSHFHITNAKAVLESHDGLLGSDAGWYQSIAAHGYGGRPPSSIRFFPLLPLLDRALSDITSLTVGIASLVITNAASLLLGIGIYALVRFEFQDTVVARRAVGLIMLGPPAF